MRRLLRRWRKRTPLTDPTNVRLRVVCRACNTEQPRHDTDACALCGKPLRAEQ